MARNVTAAENQPMDGEEEYDKHIVQLGAKYAIIAACQTISVEYVSENLTIRNPTINKADKATKQEQRTSQQWIKQPTGQYGTIKRL